MTILRHDATHHTLDGLAGRIPESPEQRVELLQRLLGKVWTDRLAKAKTTKRAPKKPPRAYLKGGHSSADRILRGVHKEIPIKPRKPT